MIVRPATVLDLAHVCADPWPQAHEEARNSGVDDPTAWTRQCFGDHGMLSWAIVDAGEPLMVCGVAPQHGLWLVYALATPRFEERPMATRHMCRIVRRAAQSVRKDIWCLSSAPRADKWLRTMGFRFVDNQGSVSVYRFPYPES
jgi:hypothetical protein